MTYELIRQKKNSFEREFAVAEVEKILKGWPKEIDHHRIVIALGSEPANERDTNATRKSLVDFRFVLQLGVLSLDRLELDGNLLARDNVDAEVDIT